jgi:hypothetical protein
LTVNVWLAIVIVPLRAAPVFAATVKPTEPLPVPLAPDVIVIHDALLPAFQVHVPAEAVTATAVPVPPAAAIDSLFGAIVNVQLGDGGGVGGVGGGGAGGAGAGGAGGCAASCCVSVCVWSAMVTVPVRDPPLLAAMRSAREPLPLPWAPDVIVIHDTLLFAAHVQPVNVDTLTLAVPALELTVWLSGAIAKRQGAASCMTRTWLSLTTISPSRIEGTVLAAARNATLPLPCPDVGETSEIQLG